MPAGEEVAALARSDDRGRGRDRALVRTLFAGAGLQVATVLGAIISLPFVTRSLTSAEFGVLATVTGFVALLGFADLGLGAALTNRLAVTFGRDDAAGSRKLVSTALAATSAAASLVLVVGTLGALLLPWQAVLGARSVPESMLRASVFCLVVATALSIVGSLGQRVLYGVQRGSAANYWLVAATLASASTSVLVALLDLPLWTYVLATVGAPALVLLSCTAVTIGRERNGLRPRRSLVDRRSLLNLAGTSGWFFAIAVSAAAGYQTDALVVATFLGAAAAGTFSVALRLLGLVTQGIYPVLLQLWPAFGEALARGDSGWVRTRFRWSMVLSALVSAMLGAALVVTGPTLVGLWLTEDLRPPRSLLAALAVWTTYSLSIAPVHFLLNAAGRVRAHALMTIAVALANVPLSVVFTMQLGIAGPVVGSLVASLLFSGIPGCLVLRRTGLLRAERPS